MVERDYPVEKYSNIELLRYFNRLQNSLIKTTSNQSESTEGDSAIVKHGLTYLNVLGEILKRNIRGDLDLNEKEKEIMLALKSESQAILNNIVNIYIQNRMEHSFFDLFYNNELNKNKTNFLKLRDSLHGNMLEITKKDILTGLSFLLMLPIVTIPLSLMLLSKVEKMENVELQISASLDKLYIMIHGLDVPGMKAISKPDNENKFQATFREAKQEALIKNQVKLKYDSDYASINRQKSNITDVLQVDLKNIIISPKAQNQSSLKSNLASMINIAKNVNFSLIANRENIDVLVKPPTSTHTVQFNSSKEITSNLEDHKVQTSVLLSNSNAASATKKPN